MDRDVYWYVYKITYPNGKIYIGMDSSKDATPWGYIGSPRNKKLREDCEFWLENNDEWTLKQEILFKCKKCTLEVLRNIEKEYIRQQGANNPNIGYNLTPKFRN